MKIWYYGLKNIYHNDRILQIAWYGMINCDYHGSYTVILIQKNASIISTKSLWGTIYIAYKLFLIIYYPACLTYSKWNSMLIE